uniref:Uncharacterized protein n=1 Tax=Quercus lobata TaxID=97700 RepID=A0A7N2LK65_QUELO
MDLQCLFLPLYFLYNRNGGCSDEICLWEEEDNIICLLGCFYAMDIQNDALENTSLLEELLDPNEVPFFQSPEGTKHRKSLANMAIAKDLVQPETMYGRLDAHLELEVIPCEMRPGTAWTMSLIPCRLKCWMSANGALLYQWNSLFCFHLSSLPSLIRMEDVLVSYVFGKKKTTEVAHL